MYDEIAKFPTKEEMKKEVVQVRGYVDDEYARIRKENAGLFCTEEDFKRGLAIKAREIEIKCDDAIGKLSQDL